MLEWLNTYWDLLSANPAEYVTFGILCVGLGFVSCRLLNQSRIDVLSARLELKDDEKRNLEAERGKLEAKLSEGLGKPPDQYIELIRLGAENRVIYMESKAAEKLIESVAEQLLRSILKCERYASIDWRLVRTAEYMGTTNSKYEGYGPNEEFVVCTVVKKVGDAERAHFAATMNGGPLLLTVSPAERGVVREIGEHGFSFEAFDGVDPNDQVEVRAIGLGSFPPVDFKMRSSGTKSQDGSNP